MPGDTVEAAAAFGLRERLIASGAKPHSRMSDLSRYMLDHREELRALLAEGFAWAAIASLLAKEEGLTDDTGQPVGINAVKLAWSRLNRRDREAPPQVTTKPASPSLPEVTPAQLVSSPSRDDPFAESVPAPVAIQPARPRGIRLPAAVSVTPQQMPMPLSDSELDERLADIAKRQGGPKLATPDVL